MAEKFSVLIKYKYLDYIENAKLSGADSWEFMKGLIEYDKSGTEPLFKNPKLTGLFAVLKCDLDENREKWEERIIANRENGRKGGRPRKEITQETQPNPNNPVGYKKPSGGQPNPNNPQKPDLDSGCDLDLVSEYDLGSSGGGSAENIKQPPPQINKIIKESEMNGFFINQAVAKKFLKSNIDPLWLVGPHSFLEYVASAVRKKYPNKNDEELKSLFVSAVSWEDMQSAYTAWKTEQEKKAHILAKNIAVKRVKNNPPKKCKCGGEFKTDGITYLCMSCYHKYEFDENLVEWVFIN